MTPTKIRDYNTVFGADQRGVRPIYGKAHKLDDGWPLVSVTFMPTAEELELLNAGKPVLIDFVGTTMPPVRVGVEASHD